VKVKLTEVAKAHVRLERKWWRANRDEKDLFDDELTAARESLEKPPKLQVYEEMRGRLIRRMYLKKTRSSVYFFIDEEAKEVWVIALWGQQRGGRPDFGDLP
jgi:hypothetical protein